MFSKAFPRQPGVPVDPSNRVTGPQVDWPLTGSDSLGLGWSQWSHPVGRQGDGILMACLTIKHG